MHALSLAAMRTPKWIGQTTPCNVHEMSMLLVMYWERVSELLGRPLHHGLGNIVDDWSTGDPSISAVVAFLQAHGQIAPRRYQAPTGTLNLSAPASAAHSTRLTQRGCPILRFHTCLVILDTIGRTKSPQRTLTAH